MSTEGEPANLATQTDIQEAINGLSDLELFKLGKAGDIYCRGTRYTSGLDLLNEVVLRALQASVGKMGKKDHYRVWKTSVPIFAFLKNAMRGVANDDRTSAERRDLVRMADIRVDGTNQEPEFEWLGHWSEDDQVLAAASADHEAKMAKVDEDAAGIEGYFADDQDVLRLIEGIKDELSPAETRELWEWTQTQYETIRKRYRRGLATLSTKK